MEINFNHAQSLTRGMGAFGDGCPAGSSMMFDGAGNGMCVPDSGPTIIGASTAIPNWLILLVAAFAVGWFVQAPYAGKKR